jgi:uncharacterized protein
MNRMLSLALLAAGASSCFSLDGFIWNPRHCTGVNAESIAGTTCTEQGICSTCDEPYNFAAVGIPDELVSVVPTELSDGQRNDAYFIASSGARADVTILYAHGNFGGIEHFMERIALLHATGANVFVIEYRGFGKSTDTATPSEGQLHDDVGRARGQLEDILATRGLPSRVVLFGYSAGALATVELAATSSGCGLMLEAPFPSTQTFADDSTTIGVPQGFITRGAWDNLSRIKDVTMPLRVIHGTADTFIRVELGEQLVEAANEPKEFLPIAGAGHGNGGGDIVETLGNEAYTELITEFLDANCQP